MSNVVRIGDYRRVFVRGLTVVFGLKQVRLTRAAAASLADALREVLDRVDQDGAAGFIVRRAMHRPAGSRRKRPVFELSFEGRTQRLTRSEVIGLAYSLAFNAKRLEVVGG